MESDSDAVVVPLHRRTPDAVPVGLFTIKDLAEACGLPNQSSPNWSHTPILPRVASTPKRSCATPSRWQSSFARRTAPSRNPSVAAIAEDLQGYLMPSSKLSLVCGIA